MAGNFFSIGLVGVIYSLVLIALLHEKRDAKSFPGKVTISVGPSFQSGTAWDYCLAH